MAKTLSCPQIIRNMIERTVRYYIMQKNPHHWANIEKITLEKTESVFLSINFTADVSIDYHDYQVHGWMDEYGNAYVSCVTFTRTKALTDTEWWKPENQRTEHKFIAKKELEAFAFDE